MSEEKKEFVITAQLRAGRGKNDARRARVAGQVPMVVYGQGGEAVAVTATLAEVAAILRSPEGAKTVFTLAVEGGETAQVAFQDRQIHPLTGRLLHADLVRV
jgi:large subunit ribosomal protein L25